MNPLVIVLGVILVVIIMMSFFSKYFSGTTTLTSKLHLQGSQPEVVEKDLTNPASFNRTYSAWIYVNTWNNSTTNKMIFGRTNDVLLYLDKTAATLKCIISPTEADVVSASTVTAPTVAPIDITNNFPIQKWVFVTIVVDSAGIYDLYIDGKLVKSIKQAANATMTPPIGNIKFGKGHDTYIADAKRMPTVMSPQAVWNAYAAGNSGSSLTDAVGNYNVNLALLKDNVATSSYSLF